VVAGKPRAVGWARRLLERLGVAPDRAALVGDRVATDVAMASSSGCRGVLVLLRRDHAADLAVARIRPDYVIDNLASCSRQPRGTR